MAPSVVATTTASFVPPASGLQPPSTLSLPVNLVPVSQGNWLVACVSWATLTVGHIPDISIADDAHNWWEPIAPAGNAVSAGGTITTRSAIWVCPAFNYGPKSTPSVNQLQVMVAPSAYTSGIACTIYEVAGMSAGFSSAAIATQIASTSISTVLNEPAGQAIVFTCAGYLNSSNTATQTGAGWGSTTITGSATGVFNASNFQVVTGATSTTSTYTVVTSDQLSEVQGFVLSSVAAPSSGNPNWPALIAEVALGFGQQTPPSQLAWSNISATSPAYSLDFTQGKQYEAGQLSTGEGTILFDNPNSAFLPKNQVSWQVQWHGDGATALPGAAAASMPVTAGQLYGFSAWLGSNAQWTAGAYVSFDWRTSGNAHISFSNGSVISPGLNPQISVVADFAPATAANVVIVVNATGTPPSSTIFSAMGAPVLSMTTGLSLPASAGFTSANNSTVTTLASWAPIVNADAGTPVRIRSAWGGGNWQVQFSGSGSATPDIFNGTSAFTGLTAGNVYTTSAWLASSVPWASGVRIGFRFRNAGGTDVGDFFSSVVTNTTPTLATITATAPATTTQADIVIQAVGTPPSTTIFTAAAAQPVAPSAATGTYLTYPVNFPATSNFLTGQNTGFEGGLGTWLSSLNANLFLDSAHHRTGANSMDMSSVAAGNMAAASCNASNILTQGMPCLPGQSITLSAWIRAAASARSCNVGCDFYNSAGTHLSTIFGSNITDSTSGFTQATDNGLVIAPATAAFCRVTVRVQATAGASEHHYVDDVYMAAGWFPENGAIVTTLAPWAVSPLGPPNISPWNIPFAGFFERLPQEWDTNMRGFCEAAITDAWFGANYQPQGILVSELLDDVPYALWPCTDFKGSSIAANIAPLVASSLPASNAPLVVTQSLFGTGNATQAFGSAATTLIGAESTAIFSNIRFTNQAGMWNLTMPNGNTTNGGFSLVRLDGNFPSIATGCTIEFWFQPTTPFLAGGNTSASVVYIQNLTNVLGSIQIDNVTHPGELFFTDGNGTQTFLGSTNYQTGTPPLTHVALAFNQSTMLVYINGVLNSTIAWKYSGGATIPAKFERLAFNGNSGLPTAIGSNQCFSGYIGFISVHPGVQPASRIFTHFKAGSTGLAGEADYWRIERLMNYGNLTGRRLIQQDTTPVTTTNVVSAQDIPGQPVATSIDNIANGLLPALLYVAPCGDIVKELRSNAWNRRVLWTLGDNAFSGETPALGDVKFDYDITRVVDEIQLTQLDDGVTVIPSIISQEATAQSLYATVTNIATGYLQNETTSAYTAGPGLIDQANWQAATNASPNLRTDNITVDAATNPAVWPFVLRAAVGDQVKINRRPPGGTAFSVLGRISNTHRELEFTQDQVAGKITCIVDFSAEANALAADDAVRGQLNGQNVLSW